MDPMSTKSLDEVVENVETRKVQQRSDKPGDKFLIIWLLAKILFSVRVAIPNFLEKTFFKNLRHSIFSSNNREERSMSNGTVLRAEEEQHLCEQHFRPAGGSKHPTPLGGQRRYNAWLSGAHHSDRYGRHVLHHLWGFCRRLPVDSARVVHGLLERWPRFWINALF